MAFVLAEEYKGAQASYWKIFDACCNYVTSRTVVTLALYFSGESRAADVTNVVLYRPVDIEGVDMDREAMYTKIKQIEPFTSAVDLI